MSASMLALVLLQATGAAPELGVLTHRNALTDLARYDAEQRPLVSDDEVARIERDLARALALPQDWHVELRRTRADGGRDVRAKFEQVGLDEFVAAPLVDRAGRELSLRTSLDARFVVLGNVIAVGRDGATGAARDALARRADYFPLQAIPHLLDALERELARGVPSDCAVEGLGLESAQPLGLAPSVIASLRLGERDSNSSTYSVRGKLILPRAAAHPPGFEFEGSQRGGDSVLGPERTPVSFREALDYVLELRDALSLCTAWRASTGVYGNGDLAILLSDRRRPPRSPYPCSIELRAAAPDELGSAPRFSFGGVELSSDGLRAVLDAIANEYDPAVAAPLFVYGCRELGEIHVILSDLPKYGHYEVRAPVLRLAVDAAGDALHTTTREAVRDVRTYCDLGRDYWSFEYADGCRAELSIHRPVMCGEGLDLTPRGRFGSHELGLAGGLAQSESR
ncbi:MAG: hypothetical protein HZA52_15410 [Planctomycetes bacterium]|nr:hypothetical protein [Planctomycetota bacterium]